MAEYTKKEKIDILEREVDSLKKFIHRSTKHYSETKLNLTERILKRKKLDLEKSELLLSVLKKSIKL